MGFRRPSIPSYVIFREVWVERRQGSGRGGWSRDHWHTDYWDCTVRVWFTEQWTLHTKERGLGHAASSSGRKEMQAVPPQHWVFSWALPWQGWRGGTRGLEPLPKGRLSSHPASSARTWVCWLHLSWPTPQLILDLLKASACSFFSDWTEPLCALLTPWFSFKNPLAY